MYWPLPHIQDSLDQAVKSIAQEELGNLSRDRTDEELRPAVTRGLEALGKLRMGESPDYADPWTALLYLTWYQPRQIGIAAQVLGPWMSLPPRGSSVCILDYGCGALATQFALATAVAHWRRLEQRSFRIIGIDPSETMRGLGEKLWNNLRSLPKDPELTEFNRAMDDIRAESAGSLGDLPARVPDTDYWLTAVHAIYESNQREVQSEIHQLRARYNARPIAVTCHARSAPIAKFVLPEGESRPIVGLECQYPRITKWRRELDNRVPHDFLKHPVTASVPDTILRELR